MKQRLLSAAIITCLLCGATVLSSCTQVASFFESYPTKPLRAKRYVKPLPYYDADAYVSNLALGRLALSSGPDSAEDVSDTLAVINGYATQKKRKTETVTLIIIDYKTHSERKERQIVAPVSVSKGDLSSLQAVMDKFHASGTIQNIRLAAVSIRPDKSLALPKDTELLPLTLDDQQMRLLILSQPLGIAENIRTQLALIDFFARNHFQDAAYLSVDNVKRLLGSVALNKTLDNQTLHDFSKDLEAQEGKLKETLPYKL